MIGNKTYKLISSKVFIQRKLKTDKKRLVNHFNLFLLKTLQKKVKEDSVFDLKTKISPIFEMKLFTKKHLSYFFHPVSKETYFLKIKKDRNFLLEMIVNNISMENDQVNITIVKKCDMKKITDLLGIIIEDFEKTLYGKELSPSLEKNNVIKSALHLETQKFGKKPKNVQEQIESQDKSNELNKNSIKIEVIGLDFQPSHYHALNAIQKILEETNYCGNIQGTYLSRYSNSFKFEGIVPRIKFSRSNFLNAYGVTKYFSTRNKMEFSGKESKIALEALYYLGTQPHLIISTRKRKEFGKEVVDRYQTVSPLLRIYEGWEGLTPFENKSLDEGQVLESLNSKHRGFVLEPCPLLVDQLDTYFVLKPANMYQEIKLKFPNASKFAYTFIDWIVKEATLKKMFESNKDKYWPNRIEIGFESLVYALRMNSYIRSRNWKKIDMALKRCIEISISLSWLLKHESVEGKTIKRKEVFYLNKKKFEQISKEKITTHFH